MNIKMATWNIHQQGSVAPEIPLWIIDELKHCDIIMLNEFNCRAENSIDFYQSLNANGYDYFVTDYQTRGFVNDTLIALKRRKEITVLDSRIVKAYRESYSTNSRFVDYNVIPENLCVDIKIDNKIITLISVRIKTLKGNQPKRFEQFKWLNNSIKFIENSVIVAGDFNTNRILGDENEEWCNVKGIYNGTVEWSGKIGKKYESWNYNYQLIRNIAKGSGRFDFYKPEKLLSSVGATLVGNQAIPPKPNRLYNNKYDLILSDLNIEKTEYNWDFLDRYEKEFFEDGKIKIGLPDHAILFSELNI